LKTDSSAVQLDEKAIIAVGWRKVMKETADFYSSVHFRLMRLRKPWKEISQYRSRLSSRIFPE
jgi:hypothetical protein